MSVATSKLNMSVNEWLAIISYLFLLFWPLEIIGALNVFYTLQYKKRKVGEVILFLNDCVKFLLRETGLRPNPDFCIKTTDFQNNGNYY